MHVNGKPMRTEGVHNRLIYEIEGEDGEEDNKPERALAGSSPDADAKAGYPIKFPPDVAKQFLEDLKNTPAQDRKQLFDDLLKKGTIVRPSRPTHNLSIQGKQNDGTVIVEFDVDEKGAVEQPNIVEVQGTVLSQDLTQRILEEVGYYRYEPLVIDAAPVRVHGVRHLIELRFHED